MDVNGEIISGQFDQPNNEFSLKRVKHLTTESTLNEAQIDSLYQYLERHKYEDGGQVITLYDQIPFQLDQEEIMQLIDDLKQVKSLYQ
ncbi:hypothetical protein [Alkalibacillus aidingensis]|uniref:hypothetical protein n=1 Tax=Alkalibacillus aidingensis TaxID=2747607 RepID=UPI0016607B78|nr:hypothetical protein [Alkalibacillus aidingensis]